MLTIGKLATYFCVLLRFRWLALLLGLHNCSRVLADLPCQHETSTVEVGPQQATGKKEQR